MISLNFKNRYYQPIGLDIGHSFIKMIQLATVGEQIVVVAADKVRIDPEIGDDAQEKRAFIISSIKQMLEEGHFHGNEVVSSLPNEDLHMTSLRLSEMDEKKIEQAVRKEAEHRFGLKSPEDLVNYLVVGSVRHGDDIKNELILFAAGNDAIKNRIEMLEEATLVPVGIEPLSCALFRSFDRSLRRQEDWEKTIVFVDVGGRYTNVVFGRDGQISLVKEIPMGAEIFNTKIADKLGISVGETEMLRASLQKEKEENTLKTSLASGRDPVGLKQEIDVSTRQVIVDSIGAIAQELAREISLCFRYFTVTFRGKRVERAVFSGGGAYENILLNVLKRQLTVNVEVAQPLRGFDMSSLYFDSCRRDNLCEWAVAAGLSLKGLDARVDITEEIQK